MVDLSVNFAGVELKNPLVVASSDCVCDLRQIKKAEECGASAVILKAIFPPHSIALQSKLRIFIDAKGQALHGGAGARRLSHEEGMELMKAAKKETKIRIGANIPFFKLEDADFTAEVAKSMATAGADFIEVNITPQLPTHLGIMQKSEEVKAEPEKEVKRAGELMRQLPTLALEATRIIKQAVKIPVVAKLTPEGVNAVSIAMAMERGGADAIDAIDSMGGAFKVDIFSRGKPKIPGAKNSVLRVSGAPMKPYAQGVVARVSKALKIPVMGTGGLMNWNDTVEMIMFGATTVSFCALLMIRGFEALMDIEEELRRFMVQQGYKNVSDFRGLALKYVALSTLECEVIPCVARIDEEQCTGCGICLRPAHCLAITMEDEVAVVNEAECLGCGTCSLLCPANAISMIAV
jgi:dihydroorotate dehydrogenase/NAD-dependent dihydropyrimidine dehydrogenase PreA subunit